MLRYPEISLGRELLNTSRIIFADPSQEVRISSQIMEGSPYTWDSPDSFNPRLKVQVPGIQVINAGGLQVNTAVIIIKDDGSDYELKIEDDKADLIPDDEFNMEFLMAIRQFEPSPFILTRRERIAARVMLGNPL